jgi:hypothetical protein
MDTANAPARRAHDLTHMHNELGRTMSSPKRLARIAGLLYLNVAIFAGFAFNYAISSVYVPGDAAATAQKLAASPGLVPVIGARSLPATDRSDQQGLRG